jgi:hypothetical protein
VKLNKQVRGGVAARTFPSLYPDLFGTAQDKAMSAMQPASNTGDQYQNLAEDAAVPVGQWKDGNGDCFNHTDSC